MDTSMAIKRTTDEIERDANRLLEGTIEHLAQRAGLWVLPNQRKTEIGIDFTFEILNRVKDAEVKTYGTFYLQNKGTDECVTVLKQGVNRGLISFQLDGVNHIEYFCLSVDQPIVITLCDLTTKTIFWLPVQLHAERYIQELKRIKNDIANKARKTDSIQLYFDPAKHILKDGLPHEQNFELFLDDIKASKEYLVNRYKSKSAHYYKGQRPLNGLMIDKQTAFVDQLNAYVNFRFKELNFVPVDFFIHYYPIEVNDGATASHFQGFVLKPGNKSLVSLFEKIRFDGNKLHNIPEELKDIADIEKKLVNISRHFRRIGILYVEDDRRTYVEVPSADNEEICYCSKCLFKRLMFAQSLKAAQIEQTEITEKLKQAYVHYKYGHFTTAARIVEQCAVLTAESRQLEWYFISKYNLTKLGISLSHFAWGDSKLKEQADELRTIDLGEIARLYPNLANHEFLDNLASDRLFSDANTKISSLLTKIREHYYSQLRGGSASNNYVWELLSEFDQIQSTFSENYIAFEGFSDFSHLFEKVVEGTFASHAISLNQNSRLESFSENLLTHFIHYGEPDFIIKHFKRYELKELEYKQEPDSAYSFMNLFQNFINELPLVREELDYQTNLYFRQRCNKMFGTLMALAGMLKLESKSLQSIYTSLYQFLSTEVIDIAHTLKYVQYFIARGGTKLDTDRTKEFLRLACERFDLYGNSFIETLTSQLGVSKILLSDVEVKELIRLLDSSKENRGDKSCVSLVYLFGVSVPAAQNRIKDIISTQLKQKFNGELYYLATILEIVPFDEEQFTIFLTTSKLKENQFSWNSLMGNKNKRFPQIGALINLSFKFGRDTSSSEFQDFKGIDPYYDWLLDMENFDYSKFDAKWITEYDTTHYIAQIKKYPIIRNKVLSYLKANSDKHLQDYFFKRLLE
ncbi:DUF4365 domain-containing protein [Chryseosolibacter indicus]|uniref:DUF4365 domain-containing protein n=1 Tax=Chryseosolibacter indicus TaxID=2782351 RepID=A0ABS5VWE3_9BACT|nr:DUF4365 domain-containing protein [Chryseosolibacter indicus]MBT1705551.1 DUF4365 domain-containing protein [Chryseosolibacter indicus]